MMKFQAVVELCMIVQTPHDLLQEEVEEEAVKYQGEILLCEEENVVPDCTPVCYPLFSLFHGIVFLHLHQLQCHRLHYYYH